MGKDDLADFVAINLALTKSVADLTDTNACLMKKFDSWTNNSGGGGGNGSHPSDKWYKHCKRNI